MLARAVTALLVSVSLAGCEAEPLTPETADRLERVFANLPERDAIGVLQNLRMTGLYSGPIDMGWQPSVAEALNEVHFELDAFDGRYDLSTDAGANAFVTDMSSWRVRERLTEDLSIALPEYEQLVAPATDATFRNGECRVSGGRYSRNGELTELTFVYTRRAGEARLLTDGLPGNVLIPMIVGVRFGEETLVTNLNSDSAGFVTRLSFFNSDNRMIIAALKRGNRFNVSQDALGEFDLPTGDLYETGLALERCVEQHFND
jgi:hypothetical protein